MVKIFQGANLKKLGNVGIFLCFLIFAVLTVSLLSPITRSKAETISADYTVGAYTMSMTNDSEVDIHTSTNNDQQTYLALSNIVFANTCPNGAHIGISAKGESNALIGDNGSEISSTTPGGTLDDNSWGFSIDGGAVWNAAPLFGETPITVYNSTESEIDARTIPILFGVRLSRDIPDGIYSSDIVYTLTPDQSCFIYRINWDGNGGVIPEGFPEYLNQDDRLDLSSFPRPTRDYYDFAGWRINGIIFSGDETEADINPYDDANITVETLWTPTPYTVSYALNGGAAENETVYNVESEPITLNNPTRTFYTFRGWSGTGLSGDANKSVTIATGSHGNRNYTANWDPIPYSISYALDGGSANNPTTYNVDTNTFTLTNPTKNAYDFTGWSGTGLTGSSNTTVTISKGSTGDRSYAAHWTLTNFTLSYNLNGGTVATANPTTYTLETNSFTLNNPSRTYYTFAGWSGTGLTGTTNTNVTVAKGSTGNRSYTANWNPVNYTISYNLNGGSVSPANPTSYNIETANFTLRNPTRSGYTFTGWTGTNGATAQTSVSIPKGSVGNRSYTANWKLASYAASVSTYGASRSCDRYCSCPHGSHEGPGHCQYDESVGIGVSWGESCGPYTCNSGDTVSGSTCYHYSCPNGGTLSGTTCYL